jgi:hypothetical protein
MKRYLGLDLNALVASVDLSALYPPEILKI